MEFSEKKTQIMDLLSASNQLFSDSRQRSSSSVYQLMMIISDGRGLYAEHSEQLVKEAVRRLEGSGVMTVFIVLDTGSSSILDIRVPQFGANSQLTFSSYMDSFPFQFYLILRNIDSLPSVLARALRQWLQLVS